MEKNRQKKKFWLIYGDSEHYKQYDKITFLDGNNQDAGSMSWGDFKRFANTPRGAQQLMDYYADNKGEIRFKVAGRDKIGKVKARNMNYVFESTDKLKFEKLPEKEFEKIKVQGLTKHCAPTYDFSKLEFTPKKLKVWRRDLKEKRDNQREKILRTLERIDATVTKRKNVTGANLSKQDVCLVPNDKGELVHPLKMLDETYVEESILGGLTMFNVDDINYRLGKLLVDDEFVMNCFLYANKVVVEAHGVKQVGKVVENKKIKFVFPDEVLIPKGDIKMLGDSGDLAYYEVQPSKSKKKLALRPPVLGEPVVLVAFKKGDEIVPSVSNGVINKGGEHTCSSIEGCCTGILVSRKDGKVVAWHCAGGTYVNRSWPVTEEIVKHLNL